MSRRAIAATATAGLLALSAPLGVASLATASPGQEVLVFAHPDVSDLSPNGEVANYENEIAATGANLTRFDGGDGSAAAWSAALEGVDLLFFPEEEGDYPLFELGADPSGAWLSDKAAEAVGAWVNAGGDVLFAGSATGDWGADYMGSSMGRLLEVFTALPYAAAWQVSGREDVPDFSLNLAFASSGLPSTLDWEDGTYTLLWNEAWTTDLRAPLTEVYFGGDEDRSLLAVGIFSVCEGSVSFSAFDGYEFADNDDDGGVIDGGAGEVTDGVESAALFADAGWPQVVRALVDGAIAPSGTPAECVDFAQEPNELAETGVATDASLVAGAAGLALLGGVALMAVRRRVSAQQ